MLCVSCGGGSASDTSTSTVANQLSSTLTNEVARNNVVGCTAAVRKGNLIWEGAAGLADLSTNTPLAPDSLMRVASITKTFTATVAMSEVDKGNLVLDSIASTWIPAVVGSDQYTLRHLLSHRTGLRAYQTMPTFVAAGGFGDPSVVWTPSSLVALVENEPLAFIPGSQYAYSNTNFIEVGMIVEAAAATPIQTLLHERIFKPLGLTRTWLDGVETIPEPLAHSYSSRFTTTGAPRNPPGSLVDTTYAWNPSIAWTTGALVSTAPQVAKFYEALLKGQILPAARVTEMLTTPDPNTITPSYGLGLIRFGTGSNESWGHSGDHAGYLSIAAAKPDGSLVVVAVCNDDHVPDAPRAIAESLGIVAGSQ